MSSSLVCSFCGFELDKSSFSVYDSVESCPHCGSVLKDEQVFSHDSGSIEFSSSYANADGSKRYGHGFDESQQKRLPSHQISTGKKKLKRLISSVCSKLNLPSEIVEQTERFVLDKVYENSKFKMTPAKIRMVGSCVYIICRTNNLPVTLSQIGVACGCSHYYIGQYLKAIDIEFGLHQAPVTVHDLVPIACSYFSKPKECEELALQLFEQTNSAMILQAVALPKAMAHAIIASLALNKGTTQAAEINNLCEKMMQGAERTVGTCVKTVKRHMLKLVEEIPWIDMKYVKNANVHFYAKDIVKYRKKIGAFAAESDSPSWFNEKEKEIENRSEKIKNAQERIRLKTVCEAGKDDGILVDGEGASKNVQDTCGDADAVELDEEDKTIEDLLEMGCSTKDLVEGYYESLKSTLAMQSDNILEDEIDSYVRTPEEVEKFKRIAEKKEESPVPFKKKLRVRALVI